MASPPFADSDGYRGRAKGYSGTAVAGQTTNLDFAIGAEDRYMNGGRLILKNQVEGDYVKFQVVDVDNIFGLGANTVLDQFVDTWYVAEDRQQQEGLGYNYVAKINAGLYIRLIYVSTGGTDVKVKLNLVLSKKT